MATQEWTKPLVDHAPVLALALLNWMLTRQCNSLFERLKESEKNLGSAIQSEILVTYQHGERANETWLIGRVRKVSGPDLNEQG